MALDHAMINSLDGFNPIRRAVWAVDALVGEFQLQRRAVAAFTELFESAGVARKVTIQPVCLVSSGGSLEASLKSGRDRVNRLLEALDRTAILPLELLICDTRSTRGRAAALLKFAHEAGAELILLGTHARRGPARWFRGSLTETLSLQSDVPLFVVNPSWNERPALKEILFPLDFTRGALEALEKVLPFARATQLKLRLFHKYGTYITPDWDLNLKPCPDLAENQDLTETREELSRWKEAVRTAGVPAVAELDTEPGSVSRAILERAELRPCMVAMAARSTRVDTAIMGSVTRDLMRECAAPLWLVCENFQISNRELRSLGAKSSS